MNRKQVLLATSTVLLSGALAHAQGTQPQSSQQQQQPQNI